MKEFLWTKKLRKTMMRTDCWYGKFLILCVISLQFFRDKRDVSSIFICFKEKENMTREISLEFSFWSSTLDLNFCHLKFIEKLLYSSFSVKWMRTKSLLSFIAYRKVNSTELFEKKVSYHQEWLLTLREKKKTDHQEWLLNLLDWHPTF